MPCPRQSAGLRCCSSATHWVWGAVRSGARAETSIAEAEGVCLTRRREEHRPWGRHRHTPYPLSSFAASRLRVRHLNRAFRIHPYLRRDTNGLNDGGEREDRHQIREITIDPASVTDPRAPAFIGCVRAITRLPILDRTHVTRTGLGNNPGSSHSPARKVSEGVTCSA